MRVGDLVLCAGRPALIIGRKTGNVEFLYILTSRGRKVMINRAHLKIICKRRGEDDSNEDDSSHQ